VWIGDRGAKQEEDSINVAGLSFLLFWSSDAVTDIRSQIEISTPRAVSLVLVR
jgi:hypothetical protein